MPKPLFAVFVTLVLFLPGVLSWLVAEWVTKKLRPGRKQVFLGAATIIGWCGVTGFLAWYFLEPWSPNETPLTEEFRVEVSLLMAAVQSLVGICIAIGWLVKYRNLDQASTNEPTAPL